MSAPTRLDWRGIYVAPGVPCRRVRRRSRSAWLRGGLLSVGRVLVVGGIVLVQAAIFLALVLAVVAVAVAFLGPR